MSIESLGGVHEAVEPSAEFRSKARIKSEAQYQQLYQESLHSPDTFWRREARDLVLRETWKSTCEWHPPHARWFTEARLNVTESCLDRHLEGQHRDQRAIVWESEEGEVTTLTYAELHQAVVDFAAALRHLGVGKGDRVAIYMGMTPEAVIAMLACARVGAPHMVVFGGFAAESLRERIRDCQAKLVLTQDGAPRRGKIVPLKATVDEAVRDLAVVEKVVVYARLGAAISCSLTPGRDIDWHQAIADARGKASGEAEIVEAEHPLFILYTSGSTGRPKGVLHTTAGYLVGAHVSTKYVFDLQPDDVYWCTADIGWVTGHSYIVYGPLSNGATCLIYEGAPNHPDWGRFWHIIERHKVSILYTAPTAIRAFIKAGDAWVDQADLSSLRLLGSVGEPINPEAWRWYHKKVGRGRCPIVDTWWQTETGSILLTTLPGAHAAKPGATGLPFFGVEPAIMDPGGTELPAEEGGLLVMKRPWPSMLRTIWGDDERFKQQYFSEIEDTYVTGDGARCDQQGYYYVVGRIDDVLNVAGHRIGTAEIESVLVGHLAVAEAAAVGRPDDLKGQALVVFVSLKTGYLPTEETRQLLRAHVAHEVGKFAQPDDIRFAETLPKTRSGKIMRRLLKDVAAGHETRGDVSTLEDRSVLESLRNS